MKRTFTDMIGKSITVDMPPQRIVSLVPSQTELLYDLGLEAEVAGITKFCIHPEKWFRSKTRIGGTKNLNIDAIRKLQPDLIIANKEENEKEQVTALAAEFPVWTSDIHTLHDALYMIQQVGELTGKATRAMEIVTEIKNGFASIQKSGVNYRVAYFIWYKPWMTAGGDTFINSMIETLGWENVYRDVMRYPETDMKELALHKPELVLLSSEPFPFKEKHIEEVKETLSGARVILVDGEMFSWYGSRLIKAIGYLEGLMA